MNRLVLLLAGVLIICASANVSALTCDSLSMDVTAELSNDVGFEGMYKYTVTGSWAVSGAEQGEGLSYLMFSLGAACPCICCRPRRSWLLAKRKF